MGSWLSVERGYTGIAAQPTFSPAGGTYTSSQSVTISTGTPGAAIYYTQDGSTPTVAGTRYTGPVTVSGTETLKAIAVLPANQPSTIASAAYVITGGGSGFLPAGHWIAAKQAMIQIYPRPDTETNTFARHRWAYYDGSNPVKYRIPIGVAFGAYPYIYVLDSASQALGMSIVATIWDTAWGTPSSGTSVMAALAAGYGYLEWTPTGAVSDHPVTITVTDQQSNTLTIAFTVSTSSSTGRFIFIDAVNGNDSTGTGAISTPWQTLTKAFGSSYATAVNGGTICYLRGTGGTYTPPVYSDQDVGASGTAVFELHTANKPSAIVAFPSDASAPVMSMSSCMIGTNLGGADLFLQGLNPNGHNASAVNARLVWAVGTGNSGSRMTFDAIDWVNSGYGASGTNDATGYFIDGNNQASPTQYVFINHCSENTRQSGQPGNNYAGCSFYSVDGALVQGCSTIQNGLIVDEAWQFKSDVKNGCMRGNVVNVGASGACQYAFSFLQSPYNLTGSSETCYNILYGGSAGGIFSPIDGPYAYGPLWEYRNSVSAITGLGCLQQNSNGPYVFDSNAVQTSKTPMPPTGTSVQSDGLNIAAASGLLDTNGYLTATYSSYFGKVGAQIA